MEAEPDGHAGDQGGGTDERYSEIDLSGSAGSRHEATLSAQSSEGDPPDESGEADREEHHTEGVATGAAARHGRGDRDEESCRLSEDRDPSSAPALRRAPAAARPIVLP